MLCYVNSIGALKTLLNLLITIYQIGIINLSIYIVNNLILRFLRNM
jgi:hypothetical protein